MQGGDVRVWDHIPDIGSYYLSSLSGHVDAPGLDAALANALFLSMYDGDKMGNPEKASENAWPSVSNVRT